MKITDLFHVEQIDKNIRVKFAEYVPESPDQSVLGLELELPEILHRVVLNNRFQNTDIDLSDFESDPRLIRMFFDYVGVHYSEVPRFDVHLESIGRDRGISASSSGESFRKVRKLYNLRQFRPNVVSCKLTQMFGNARRVESREKSCAEDLFGDLFS